jgi:CHAD domain-containing protein
VRDAEALIEIYDKLMDLYTEELNRRAFQSVRRALTLRKNELVHHDIDLDSRLDAFKAGFEQAATRVDGWPLDKIDRDAVVAGATRIYAKARNAMKTARDHPGVGHLHEWRKRTKDHWYHLRLLKDIWRPVMGRFGKAAKHLSDVLGDDHNLAVLQSVLNREPDRFASLKGSDAITGLLKRQRKRLVDQAMMEGRRIYADKAKAFQRKIESYWDAWREEALENPAHGESSR